MYSSRVRSSLLVGYVITNHYCSLIAWFIPLKFKSTQNKAVTEIPAAQEGSTDLGIKI